MKILAPAKINLFLEITGKTKTGYHTLNTVFQAVSLYDEITITDERHHEIDFTCNWSGVGVSYSSPVEENLCYPEYLYRDFLVLKKDYFLIGIH